MACDVAQYHDLFIKYMTDLQNICTSTSSIYSDRPIKVYDKVSDFLANTTDKIKGIYVKDLRRYYQGEILSTLRTKNEACALFIVPEFGESQINTVQFLQTISISFDSFVDLDPLGERQIQFINWFINKHHDLMENAELTSGTALYTQISTISKSITNQSDQASAYIRRSIVINARYCNCGGM